MKASVSDLHTSAASILRAVARGKAMARLIPLEEEETPEAFGMWRDHDDVHDVDAFIDRFRRGRDSWS